MITQERLKQLVSYDPDTGIFIRKISLAHNAKAGSSAGTKNSQHGYLEFSIDCKTYTCHRLAWLYMFGEFPKSQIDHINHIKTDNRMKNLRCVIASENQKNRKLNKNNSSGYSGVRKIKNRWQCQIVVDTQFIYLGSFNNLSDAINARKKAEKEYGFHENHGLNN